MTDKYEIIKGLHELYNEDQECSGNCFDCEYEAQCNKLDSILNELFK